LLDIEWVHLSQDLEQLMGSPRQRVHCVKCGEEIINGREIVRSDATLCVSCAGQAYYSVQHRESVLGEQATPRRSSHIWVPREDSTRAL
jgi:hypothetical protein